MKKYLKVLLVLGVMMILTTSVVSAGFLNSITGMVPWNTCGDGVCNGFENRFDSCPIDCWDYATDCSNLISNGAYAGTFCSCLRTEIDNGVKLGPAENFCFFQNGYSYSFECYGDMGEVVSCDAGEECSEELMCEPVVFQDDVEECRDTYCVGDWELDTYLDSSVNLITPNTNGMSDQVELRHINWTDQSEITLTFEIDESLDISHLPETPSLTSENALHLVADGNEEIKLYYYRYDENIGSFVYTDEVWLWYNDGDATMFGGDANYDYVTVFYKDGATIEWFGSQSLDIGSNNLFYLANSKSFGLDSIASDEIVLSMVGGYGLYLQWALENGDFSHLGEIANSTEACEVELVP
tara:strand:+ start:6063 stop:7124 length:1062 start_codon:yes stop_codon:yes gene_type:complete